MRFRVQLISKNSDQLWRFNREGRAPASRLDHCDANKPATKQLTQRHTERRIVSGKEWKRRDSSTLRVSIGMAPSL
jgi:hypothetical protein